MPNRWLCVAILAFWGGMTSWLVYREWSQRYGSPPTMLSALDAAISQSVVDVNWRIIGNDRQIGTANTRISLEQGHHVLKQKVHLNVREVGQLPLFRLFGPVLSNLPFEHLEMSIDTGINHFGDLQSFTLRVTLPQPKFGRLRESEATGDQGPREPPPPLALFNLEGKPRADGKLEAKLTASLGGTPYTLPPPFDQPYLLPYRGKDVALGSLCPLDRMPDLRPGQSWETPVSDPAGLFMFSLPGSQDGVLAKLMDRQPAKARVLIAPELLDWQGEQFSCWVVVTDQENLHLRIWVRREDGLILKQTAEWGEVKIDIVREKNIPRE